jgi:hypothetical protein
MKALGRVVAIRLFEGARAAEQDAGERLVA